MVFRRFNIRARVLLLVVSGWGRYSLVLEHGYGLRDIPACISIIILWLNCYLTSSFCIYRVMVRRNPRRERPADQHSAEASHTLHRETVRENSPPPLNNRQDMHTPPSAPRERRFEKLRKLGATLFCGTLDPAEAESWLESTERVFNLMQCTPDESFDYAVFLLQRDAYSW